MLLPSGLQFLLKKSPESLVYIYIYFFFFAFPLLLLIFFPFLQFLVILITIVRCVHLLDNPVQDPLCFLDSDDYLLSQVREILSYYVFENSLRPFISLFSFWDPYNASISVWFCPRGFLNCPNFFPFFFPFCSLQWLTLLYLPAHWSIPLYHLVYCWFLLVYF